MPLSQFANLSSFAENILCPERSLVKIRDDIPLDCASLIGCGVTTGLGAALNTVKIPAGASVVIVGCGGVGLAALQGARIVGAGSIIAVDVKRWKFGLARDLGASDCVDATEGDPFAAVREITSGGAAFVFECVGLVPTVQQAIAMTGRGGTTVLVGVVPVTAWVPISASDLAMLGADVVHVEAIQRMDGGRSVGGAFAAWHRAWWECSLIFLLANSSKHGITLDLSDPPGIEIFESLIAGADAGPTQRRDPG